AGSGGVCCPPERVCGTRCGLEGEAYTTPKGCCPAAQVCERICCEPGAQCVFDDRFGWGCRGGGHGPCRATLGTTRVPTVGYGSGSAAPAGAAGAAQSQTEPEQPQSGRQGRRQRVRGLP